MFEIFWAKSYEIFEILPKNHIPLKVTSQLFSDRLNIAEIKTENGVNSQLSISRTDRHDSGRYKCIAENPFGRSEHIIFLAVQGMLSTKGIIHQLYNENKKLLFL